MALSRLRTDILFHFVLRQLFFLALAAPLEPENQFEAKAASGLCANQVFLIGSFFNRQQEFSFSVKEEKIYLVWRLKLSDFEFVCL